MFTEFLKCHIKKNKSSSAGLSVCSASQSARAQSLDPTWMERSHSQNLFTDLYVHAIVHTHNTE